jgi:putative peptidoglycan lipid II flippase
VNATRPRRAVLALSGLNLAGKLLAIGKTLIIATLFGTSGVLDAFWVAYSLPLMLPNLLTTVITVAFVPRFVKSLEGRTGADAWRGANTLFTLAIGVSLFACAAIQLWTGALVHRLAPGLAPENQQQAIEMIRMMLPCMLMLTLSSLLSALSNARERFVLPGLDGVVNNTAIILVALLLARGLGVRALIVGITLGFFVQMCILGFGNRDLFRSSLRPAFALGHPDFLRPLAHLLPLLVGSVGAMLTGLVDQYFVSRLDAGSISALTYATMMAMLPVEVFAQAIITSYYPALGRGVAAGDHAAVTATWRSGQRLILLLTLPCAVLLVGLAKPIVVVLLEHGRFDDRSTALTVEAMSILAIGMVFRSQAYFSYRVLHSMIRPWTQVFIGLAGVATCVGLNLVWAQRLGLRGVALSAVLSQLQSALIAALVVRRLLRADASAPRALSAQLLLPIGVLAAGVLLARVLVPASLYEASHRLWALACGFAAVPAGLAAFALAWRLGLPEAVDIAAKLRSRLARTRRLREP